MAKHSVRQGTRSASRARRTRNIVLVVVGVVLALAAVCGFLGYRFYREALQVRDHELAAVQALQGLQDSEQLKDTDALNEAVAQAQEHASAAKEITDGGLWKAASFVPVVGDDVKTVRGMVDVVDGVVGQTLPVLASTMQNLMGAELSGGEGQLNLQPIIDAQDGLVRANELMQEQASAIEDLPTPHIGMVRSAYEQGRDQLTKVADMLDGVSGMVQVAPKMLGADGSRTYLLVAQTTSEQRSGGGLVGSLGTMHTEQGKISVGGIPSRERFRWGISTRIRNSSLWVRAPMMRNMTCSRRPCVSRWISGICLLCRISPAWLKCSIMCGRNRNTHVRWMASS